MKKIIIYTDGAAKGNPGNGGYGIVMKYGTYRKEFSEGFRKTTNNRMELLAVIIALEGVKKEQSVITVYSDSKYVVGSICVIPRAPPQLPFKSFEFTNLSSIIFKVANNCFL